jgi:hypothetical protein
MMSRILDIRDPESTEDADQGPTAQVQRTVSGRVVTLTSGSVKAITTVAPASAMAVASGYPKPRGCQG